VASRRGIGAKLQFGPSQSVATFNRRKLASPWLMGTGFRTVTFRIRFPASTGSPICSTSWAPPTRLSSAPSRLMRIFKETRAGNGESEAFLYRIFCCIRIRGKLVRNAHCHGYLGVYQPDGAL